MSEQPAIGALGQLPATAEVAIIGGGFAGMATAWALAQRGVSAVVLEREGAPGKLASGRSAGLGRQLAEDDATTRLTVRGAELLRGPLAAAWQACGGILSFDQVAAADDYAARAARMGVEVERLDRAAVLARWPDLEELPIAAGLWIASDGIIDVRGLLAALAHGVRVVCDAGVVRIEPAAAGARLITAKGAISARVVVDATGAWAGGLTGDPPLESFKRHVFLLDEEVAAGAPYVWHLGSGELYVRGDAAGLLVSPCDAQATAAADQLPDSLGDAVLEVKLADTGWARARVTRKWACQRAFAPDRRMRLGRDPARPWLVWAAALGGHGATAAAAVGEVVAEACLAALAPIG
ncbi:MAG TPA: FAD-dependent oxidoreductase [Kofleriaceae bacterium]